MRWITALCLIALVSLAVKPPLSSSARAERDIRAVLEAQQEAWNRGDLAGFMQGYWTSERTQFVGPSGINRGWQAVYDRYQKAYPNRDAMGKLTFSKLEITPMGNDYAYALGEWRLDRAADQPDGVFTVILRRFPGGWRIIHDHTSPAAGK